MRGAGFVWSPYIVNPGRVAHQMVHITDWLPTLISAAGKIYIVVYFEVLFIIIIIIFKTLPHYVGITVLS